MAPFRREIFNTFAFNQREQKLFSNSPAFRPTLLAIVSQSGTAASSPSALLSPQYQRRVAKMAKGYLSSRSFQSFGSLHASSSNRNSHFQPRRKPSKSLNYNSKSKISSLPFRTKYNKMSPFGNSNKRARADDDPNERPSKKPCPSPSVPPTTGLEEDEEDLAPAPMVPATKRTSRFNHAYEKRRNSTDLRVKADRVRH